MYCPRKRLRSECVYKALDLIPTLNKSQLVTHLIPALMRAEAVLDHLLTEFELGMWLRS